MPPAFGKSLESTKNWFFDSPKVLAAVEKAERGVLSRQGAFIRRRAKSSIRKRKAASQPGNPPSSHTGLLRDYIFFAFDPVTRSVVIGPTKTNQVSFTQDKAGHWRSTTGTGAAALEYGGSITRLEVLRKWAGGEEEWVRADLRSARRIQYLKKRMRTIHMAARPYMRPAESAERSKFAPMFRNTVRAA